MFLYSLVHCQVEVARLHGIKDLKTAWQGYMPCLPYPALTGYYGLDT